MSTMPMASQPLSLSIKDRAVLYNSYMSCVRHGGLFIPTGRPSHMGEEVTLMLDLMDEPERIPVKGRIIWITPRNTQDNRTQGVGIQFSEPNSLARTRIETYLAGVLASERPTHTM